MEGENLNRFALDHLHYEPYKPQENWVRDYNKLQGVYNATDLHHQIVRDINARHVTLENSSEIPVGIGITTYYAGPLPKARFVLYPGEVKHLGINSQGDADQFIHLLNPTTGSPLGKPQIFDRISNQFVVRYGLNNVYIQKFQRGSYRPAF